MRKIILLILVLGIAFSIGLVVMPAAKPKDVPKELLTLPAIKLLLTDSQTIINTADFPVNKATVLFYFDPGCSHCQDETEDLLANHEILKQVNFIFISADSMKRIRNFAWHYNLDRFKEITVTKDYEYKALSRLQIKSIPTNLVYDRKHELVKIFVGDLNVKELKKLL